MTTQNANLTQSATSRDHLALVRTELASERTLLSYGRTAIMMVATGVSIVKFFPELANATQFGWAFSMLGALILCLGAYRFQSLRKRLRKQTTL